MGPQVAAAVGATTTSTKDSQIGKEERNSDT